MVALGEVWGVEEIHPRRSLYASRRASHGWPRLVREVAHESEPGWVAEAEADVAAFPVPDAAAVSDPEAAVPDPEDELFLLGERCAEAYMQADALQYRAMKLLAEFHRREGWRDTGFSSTAEWLANRIGIQLHTARDRVRTAVALEQLPLTSRAMRDGELSFAKVRAITRAARPESEAALLEIAHAGSAANLERVVRAWKKLDRKSELAAEQIRHRSRRFSAWVDDDGTVVVRGRLDPEVGALLMRAVEAASDALFRGEARDSDAGLPETTPEQRRADAVGLMAERALAAGFGGTEESGEDPAPISGTRAERYQVMLHVDEATLEEEGEGDRSELEDGTRVPAGTSRRIACDSGVVRVSHGPDGQVTGAGRRTRTVPPAVRRALEARDRGCRFPGCGLRFTDAHHVKHWADGGETSLRNLVLLCKRHHRAVHEGGVKVCIDVTGQVVFFSPRGKALMGAPPRRIDRTSPAGASMEGASPAALRPPPIRPGARIPRWKRDADIPWEIEARAWEALDSG
jgi:hypothetical protein